MAGARKAPSRRSYRQDRWEIGQDLDVDPLRVVECADDDALAAARADLQSRAVPLGESPPLRARLVRHPGGDVLMLNASHAAMDGYGVLRVLRSVARAYTGDDDPAPKATTSEASQHLGRLIDAGFATRVRRHLALAEKARDLITPPARVAPDGGTHVVAAPLASVVRFRERPAAPPLIATVAPEMAVPSPRRNVTARTPRDREVSRSSYDWDVTEG